MLISMPTAENAGAEPMSIVAATAGHASVDSRRRVLKLIPRQSVGVFTFTQPPLMSGGVRDAVNAHAQAGFPRRTALLSGAALLALSSGIYVFHMERNGYAAVALTMFAPQPGLGIAFLQMRMICICNCRPLR